MNVIQLCDWYGAEVILLIGVYETKDDDFCLFYNDNDTFQTLLICQDFCWEFSSVGQKLSSTEDKIPNNSYLLNKLISNVIQKSEAISFNTVSM